MYTLVLNKIFQYKLIVSGYLKINTLSFKTNESISINILAWIARMFASTEIKIMHGMNILSSKLIQKISNDLNIGNINIVPTIKSREKISMLFEVPFLLNFLGTLKMKLSSNIFIPLTIVATAILGKFFTLAQHDIFTLGYFDTQTLGDMDYTEQ